MKEAQVAQAENQRTAPPRARQLRHFHTGGELSTITDRPRWLPIGQTGADISFDWLRVRIILHNPTPSLTKVGGCCFRVMKKERFNCAQVKLWLHNILHDL